jgi:hypothetical protein
LPIVLPLLAAVAIGGFGLAGKNLGRIAAAGGAWGSAAALIGVWLPVRSSLELLLGQLGFGSAFDLRIDGVSLAFGLMIIVPAAVLLTLQPRTWPETAISLLGVSAATAAVEAGGLILTAIAGGTAATVGAVLLETEDPSAPRPSWGLLLAGWLVLSLAGVTLQVGGGTAVYSAVPVAAVTAPVFTLLALSALLVSGLFPWRMWPAQLWTRPSLRAAGITIATLYPLGFYLLVRGYELGDGRYPSQFFNVLLALIGLAVALASAGRAQAATTRRGFLVEVVPGLGGFALSALALGTALGLVAGMILLDTAAVLVACLALLPDRVGITSLLTVAAAVGLPPGVAFGARVIGIEATFEAGDFLGLIGVASAAVWVTWIVAGARAIGLPGGRGHPAAETFPRAALAIAAMTLVVGPALAVLQIGLANPVTSEVMRSSAVPLGGGLTSVITISSVLPAVALFAPLLVIAVVAYLVAGTSAIRTQARPPLFDLPVARAMERTRSAIRSATVPEQYRSILNFRELEAAAARAGPIYWLGALFALGFAVTR